MSSDVQPPAPSAPSTVCDPLEPQPTTAQLRQTSLTTLSPGRPFHSELCNARWHWFIIPTDAIVTSVTSVQSIGVDGVVAPQSLSLNSTQRHTVIISFDGTWDARANRYPTSDFVIANGASALPGGWDNPTDFLPESDARGPHPNRPSLRSSLWSHAICALTCPGRAATGCDVADARVLAVARSADPCRGAELDVHGRAGLHGRDGGSGLRRHPMRVGQ
jgi:hypothetical protein